MKRAALTVLFTFALCPITVFAQNLPGTPPFGTFGGGPDVIDLANLNSHITIPVINKSGRGQNFVYNITYDSAVWNPITSGSGKTWFPAPNWGFSVSLTAAFGYVNQTASIGIPCFSGGGIGGLHQTGTRTTYGWAYIDPNGAGHGFGSTVGVSGTCTGYSTTSINVTASDGSGYTFSAIGPTMTSLSNAKGQALSVPVNPTGFAAGSVTDSNGNVISSSGTGTFTDTLGTTVLTITGSGTSQVVFTYTNPSGAGSQYKVNFTSYTVATNFGVSGISEFGKTAESLVSSIVLPDGSQYTLTYESTPSTPSSGACTPLAGTYSANCVTARLASMQVPTGGTISYAYSGGNNGILSDGTTATLTRTTPDSGSNHWTYARTLGTSPASTTTVTDPQGNQTVFNFQGIYQTERQVYSGTTTLLKTIFACYNGATPNCNATNVTLPISSKAVYVEWPSGLESKRVTDYNTYGLVTEKDEYDYGSGAPGSLLRKTLTSYASLGNIVNKPASVTTENGAGTTVAQTTYQYDQSSLTTTSGTPQHVSVSGPRGNVTTISYLVQATGTLSKIFRYYDTGNVYSSMDVNGQLTTYTYGDCGNSFPTAIAEPLSLSESMVWSCNGGVMTSLTDENGNTISTTYGDPNFWRPTARKDQALNTTNYTYANPNSVESSLLFNSNNSTTDILATLDGLGRTLVTQKKQSPSSSTYDSVETDYDSLGRPYQTTVPYSGTAGQTDSSAPAIAKTYDALGRPLLMTDGGGGTVSRSYAANDVLRTVGPAPSGENTKRRQFEYNGIKQLTSVCEITGISGSGTCGQTTSATGYWTKYAYDVLGDLLTLTQDAQSSNAQSRSYTYDGLGRMTSEVNPETGAKYYFYDTDPGTKGGANCSGTYDGDLVKIVDAAGNVTCYTYDALHRQTSVTYPYGPNSSNTPSKYFAYDSATVNSVAMANAKTRLAEAYTCVSTCSSKLTDEGFSYTVRGEVQDIYESTPHSGGYFHVDETYWANGGVEQISGLSSLPTITYGVDGEGRVSTVSAGSGQNPVSSTTYNVASKTTQINLGSGDNDAFQFDPNTFRMTQYQFNINGQSDTGKLTWNANGSLGSLNITDAFNSADTQSCAYTHDDLARIASANCGSIWSQTFSYDAFGNITKAGTNSFNPGYNVATNRMSTGATYDANGDVLTDSLHSYAWDATGRPTTIDGITVTYDALARMVEQNGSTQIVWSPSVGKLGFMNGSTFDQANVPLPTGMLAAYNSSGLLVYHHVDWLGSYRLASTPSRTVYWDGAYAPFGEPYAQSGSSVDLSFTGQNQDTTTNLYDFPAREYGIQGRWPSPDPAGLGAAHLRNPQTLNRYAYVAGRPLLKIDPLGTDDVSGDDGFDVGTQDCEDVDCWTSGGDVGGDFDFADYDSGSCSDSDTCDTGEPNDNSDTPVCNDVDGNIIPCPTNPDCDPTNPSCVGALPIDSNIAAANAANLALLQPSPDLSPTEFSTGLLWDSPVWETPSPTRSMLRDGIEGGVGGAVGTCVVAEIVGAGPEDPVPDAICGYEALSGYFAGGVFTGVGWSVFNYFFIP